MTRGRNVDLEVRSTPLPIELRTSKGHRAIGGYAAVFRTPSKDLGGFIEIVEPTAFNKSRGDGYPDVVCRADHNDVLGSTRGGTLHLAVDSTGLDYTCDVAETRAGDDVLTLVRRGDYAGSSFAFRAMEDEWDNDGQTLVRHLISVKLLDTAPCAIPAYEASTVSLRSLAAQVDAPLSDVLDLAYVGELRKLLTRTGYQGRKIYRSPPDAVRKVQSASSKSGRQALVQLLDMRYVLSQRDSLPHKVKELTDMRYPPMPTTPAAARKRLTDMARPPVVGSDEWS